MQNKIWWKKLKPFRIGAGWRIVFNKLEDIEPDQIVSDDKEWGFLFVEDITYMVKEVTYKENKQTIKHTIAIDLGWYPDGDLGGNYRLVTILDDNWENPVLTVETRSTQEIVDTMELWMFETIPFQSDHWVKKVKNRTL